MPTYCYSGKCPPYKFPTKAEVVAENKEEEALRKEFQSYIDSIVMEKDPETEVEKCQSYCKEVAKAEAEKCRELRHKAAYVLKIAGVPARVLPYGTSTKKSSTTSSSTTSKSKSCKTCG